MHCSPRRRKCGWTGLIFTADGAGAREGQSEHRTTRTRMNNPPAQRRSHRANPHEKFVLSLCALGSTMEGARTVLPEFLRDEAPAFIPCDRRALDSATITSAQVCRHLPCRPRHRARLATGHAGCRHRAPSRRPHSGTRGPAMSRMWLAGGEGTPALQMPQDVFFLHTLHSCDRPQNCV